MGRRCNKDDSVVTGLSEKAMKSRRNCPRISLGCLCDFGQVPEIMR